MPTQDVVISGISGRFPESNSIAEFEGNLHNCVDLVSDDDRRWPPGLFGLPHRNGKLKNLKHFDAAFFGVHTKQAEVMDPQMRLLLEVIYEAILDAGINPETIRGSNTGVFIGVISLDSEEYWSSEPSRVNGYGLLGCNRAMLANRISFAFDFNGPSYAIDSACSSSMVGLQQAVIAIRTGQCDAAIVGGCNLILKPTTSLQLQKLNALSSEGSCKSFDASADGFLRSEAVAAIYVQKSSDAKRVYATVVNLKTNTDGAKPEGITFPSGASQKKLIQQVYEEANVNPADVAYVEAHGTGTKVGDVQEVNAFTDVFCEGRSSPLLIGSVKSNMGHSEATSGLSALAKTLISMERGIIPPNLHFESPNKEIHGLVDGRLQVVNKPWPFNGGYIAINSFGFGGTNTHVLLKSNPKVKQLSIRNGIPRLVCVSGRTENAVQTMMEKVIMFDDDELIALLHNIYNQNIPGHMFRGFAVLDGSPSTETVQCDNKQRPVWYIFSGTGSQWAGMAKDLLKLPQIDNSVKKSAQILHSEGFDLYNVLTSEDESTFDNVLNSFVSIIVIQVALVDFLKSIGIEPDGMIGHSVGELGCAYADGTLSSDQAILAAYWRGRSLLESQLPKGAMASIGLSWEETQKRVPPGIFAACHNSADNVTISGPPESIRTFVKQLQEENIFAKEVNSSGCAFHSKYIADARIKFRKSLEKIIGNRAKPRSSKWISTSVIESKCNDSWARLSSVDYHVNNLLSPVLFHEALNHVPENAIIIEIAPHILMQPILRRSLGSNTTILGLVKRFHHNNLEFMLNNLGKLFNAGGQLKLSNLYPTIEFPVSRGTPMIQSMIEWDHSIEWPVADFSDMGSKKIGESIVEIDTRHEEHAFYLGHVIDGIAVFPATGYLTLVWRTFATLHGKSHEEFPVLIENAQFLRSVIVPKEGVMKFSINIFEGSGEFEICESGSPAARGIIRAPSDVNDESLQLTEPYTKKGISLSTSEFYKESSLRGYNYSGIFRAIKTIDICGTTGKIEYNGNYVSFMDAMLQHAIFSLNSAEPRVPTRLQRILIDPLKQKAVMRSSPDDEGIALRYYKNIGVITCGGVEMRGLKFSIITRRQRQTPPKLEKHIFVPLEINQVDPNFGIEEALTTIIQLVSENNAQVSELKVIEFDDDNPAEDLYAKKIIDIVKWEPTRTANYIVISSSVEKVVEDMEETGAKTMTKDEFEGLVEKNYHLAIAKNSESNEIALVELAASVKEGGFVLVIEHSQKIDDTINENILDKIGLVKISKMVTEDKTLYLYRKVNHSIISQVIAISGDDYHWVEPVKAALASSVNDGEKILLVSEGDPENGILGLVNCLLKEPGGVNLRSLFILDPTAPKYSANSGLYTAQLRKDLVHNVYKNGALGTYRHLPLKRFIEKYSTKAEHAYINILLRGDLTSLRWIEGSLKYYRPEHYPGRKLCTVYYAALNFRDIMLASGRLPLDALPDNVAEQDCILGMEFSGRDSRGRRVMGIVTNHCLATSVLADPTFLWEVPEKWTLEQASSIPMVYSTAYYALIVRGQMKPGESVLIHAGSGGVGQAAISIALHMGCTVYTTVGSKEKRDYLIQNFPQLTNDHITNSRDTKFEQHVLRQTDGKGVNLVLNSLAEDKLQASLRCLAKHGRFLEIGKFDLSKNSSLGMAVFLKNTNFLGVHLDSLFDGGLHNADKQAIVKLLKEGLANGAVRPLKTTVFSENQVEQAFRYMATGKHIGKLVLKLRNEESKKVTKPDIKYIECVPRTYMHPDKSYVLVGGLGGFGLELANWLVLRGARKVILTSRSGITNGYQSLRILRWQQKGAEVLVSTTDCATIDGTEKLLGEANKLGPVGGIFNLAAVLRDRLIENLTAEDFAIVSKAKVESTKNLDLVSRKLCPQLDYFVAFSSLSCSRGNAGQSNYGYANSVMERICEARQIDGLPGTTIQWGAIGDVGLIMEKMGGNDIVIAGTIPQKMSSCLNVMDYFLHLPDTLLTSFVLAEKHILGLVSDSTGLADVIANILGMKDSKGVNLTSKLAELGMDSLMGEEIKQTIERNFGIVKTTKEIRDLSLNDLLELEQGQQK